jgi:hypothetical protein
MAGQLAAALNPAECRAAPHSSGNQLEWPGVDLLPSRCDTDDHRLPPTSMATLQCGAHGIDVADAFERIVHAAISHVDDNLLNRRAVRLRADKIRRAQALRHCEFLMVVSTAMIRLAFAITKPG